LKEIITLIINLMKKSNYKEPMVEVFSARVEAGFQTSGVQNEGNANTTRYGADSWDTPSGNPNARYN
jgi:hypothetical protein